MRRFTRAGFAIASAAALITSRLTAGGFVGAGDGFEDLIAHPPGYTGSGGALEVTVCIDPSATNAAAMEIPVRNAIFEINKLDPTTGNLVSGGDNELETFEYDFESVTVHELGHCIGLAHPNMGVQTGVGGSETEFTQSTQGADSSFDFDDGVDNIDGSADDQRDDDGNLHWFRLADNDPFDLEPVTIDSTTYSRDLGDLPTGDSFAANASRALATDLGVDGTEAVMQQGQFNDEAQRTLTADDVATLRLAMSGLDETQGTADDYTFELTYAGLTTDCDIVIESSASGFASCSLGLTYLAPDHYALVSPTFRYNPDAVDWYFNDVLKETGTIVVEKQTDPDGADGSFDFTGDVEGTIGDDETLTVADLPAGTYTATEAAHLFYDLTSISCDDGDSIVSLGTRTATFTLAAGETVTCTFTNTEQACAADDDLILSGNVVTGDETFEACQTITAGPFTVEDGGSALLVAGEKIILGDGFSVADGGSFTARIDEP